MPTVEVRSGAGVAPGDGIGTLSTFSNVQFLAGSTLQIEVASTTDLEQLHVGAGLLLANNVSLEINLLNGFVPQVGDVFEVLEFNSSLGQFSNINVPDVPGGEWDFSQLTTEGSFSFVGSFIPGDINGDGSIDLLDVQPFVDLPISGGFSDAADLNGDGAVNLLDVNPFVALLTGG